MLPIPPIGKTKTLVLTFANRHEEATPAQFTKQTRNRRAGCANRSGKLRVGEPYVNQNPIVVWRAKLLSKETQQTDNPLVNMGTRLYR